MNFSIWRCCVERYTQKILSDARDEWETEHAEHLAHYEACEFAKDNYAE